MRILFLFPKLKLPLRGTHLARFDNPDSELSVPGLGIKKKVNESTKIVWLSHLLYAATFSELKYGKNR